MPSTGREVDTDTGLMYYRARYYDPSIGRFISEDPLGFKGSGVNWYAYVGNNPVNGNDPSGMWGASLEAYAGVGGGITAAYQNGTFELTGRIGVGLGAGFQYEPQGGPSKHAQSAGADYIARTFTALQAEVGAGPIGVGGSVTHRSGNAVTTPVGGDYIEVSGTILSVTNEVSKPYFGLRFGVTYGMEIGSYSNWGNATPSPVSTTVATHVSWAEIDEDTGSYLSPQSVNTSLFGGSVSWGGLSSASGSLLDSSATSGALLSTYVYPSISSSNNNMMQSVYAK